MQIDVNTFIATAFPSHDLNGGVVGLCAGTFQCRAYSDDTATEVVAGDLPTYVVVSSLDGRARQDKDGRETLDLGRARANCREAWLFVLDDIGTKSRAPDVEPSYKMLTSIKDGVPNYQWGYFLSPFDVSTDAGVSFYEGACRAAGEAGISDPGMRGVYRLCRVPGSLHATGTRAEIVDWNPERFFDLARLCADLGLDVLATQKPVPKQIRDEDYLGGPDIALDWLAGEGYVTGVVNGDWIEIECPNGAAHTDGSLTAGYSPLDYRREGRQFKCFHGHCGHMDTAWFLQWISDMGGPAVGITEAFHMSDEVRARIQKAIKTELPKSVVTDMVLGDIREQILREWLLCESSGQFFHFDGTNSPRRFISASTFNLVHLAAMPVGPKGGRIPADKWWAAQPGRWVVNDVVWHPDRGRGVFVDEGGVTLFNAYTPYVPDGIGYDSGVAALWDGHIRRLYGADADVLIGWMAWLVQHPEQRINWCPVLHGMEGCGKSLIGQALVGALGRHYVAEVGPSAFSDAFNTFMEGKLLVLGEEIRVAGQNRFAIMDQLKTLLTNDFIDVRGMHRNRRTIRNTASYMIFTNHDDALPLDKSGRRWTIFTSEIETPERLLELGMDAEYFGVLADSYRQQPGAIYSWLKSIDVSAFDPKGRAPVTEGTEMMISETTDNLYVDVLGEIMKGVHLNANEKVFTTEAVRAITVLIDRRGGSDRKLPEEGRWRSFLRGQGWKLVNASFRSPETDRVTKVWANTRLLPGANRLDGELVRGLLAEGNGGVRTVGNVIDFEKKS